MDAHEFRLALEEDPVSVRSILGRGGNPRAATIAALSEPDSDFAQQHYGGQHLVVETWRRTEVAAPLFYFSAPDVPGCSVTVESSSKREGLSGWKISVGSGVGSSRTESVAMKASFRAAAGETKELFAQVPAIARLRHHVRKTVQSFQYSRAGECLYEMPRATTRRVSALAVKSIEPYNLPKMQDRPVEVFRLSGDRGESIAEYEYIFSEKRNVGVQLGVEFGAASANLEATISMESSLLLRFSLSLRLSQG